MFLKLYKLPEDLLNQLWEATVVDVLIALSTEFDDVHQSVKLVLPRCPYAPEVHAESEYSALVDAVDSWVLDAYADQLRNLDNGGQWALRYNLPTSQLYATESAMVQSVVDEQSRQIESLPDAPV